MKNKIGFPVILFFTFLLCCCSKSDNFTPVPQPALPPEISFTYSGANTFAPAAVSFSNATTHATGYLWDFGDNHTSSEGNPVHIYTAGGVYTVRLKAFGEAGSDSVTKTVTILNAPTTLKITSIKLTAFSFVNNAGYPWDAADGPDVYFKIITADSTVLYDGIALTDSNVVQQDLPLIWNLANPLTISDFSAKIIVSLYDNDAPAADDYIGSADFIPANYATVMNHYPAAIEINKTDVFIKLTFLWQ